MIEECYLCKSSKIVAVDTGIRDVNIMPSTDFKVLKCEDCELVFLSHHEHIVDGEFYENSKMLKSNRFLNKQMITDIEKFDSWKKNANFDDERRRNTLINTIANKNVLDYGCGAGGFLEKVHNFCNIAVGIEPDMSLVSYLENNFDEKNIQIYSNLNEVSNKFDFITCFHVMEHVKDPVNELSKLRHILNKDGKIIIEVPNINDALIDLYKIKDFKDWYFWTCHLYYFSEKTLKNIGEKAGYKVDYVKQVQRFPLSNHLHWLQKNKPNGHKVYDFLNSDRLNKAYSDELASIGMCDTLVMRLSNG